MFLMNLTYVMSAMYTMIVMCVACRRPSGNHLRTILVCSGKRMRKSKNRSKSKSNRSMSKGRSRSQTETRAEAELESEQEQE